MTTPSIRQARLAELHRQCDQDYADAAPAREGLAHRDATHLVPYAAAAAQARPSLDKGGDR